MKTRNWQKALAIVRREEIEGVAAPVSTAPTVETACQKFVHDAKARELKDPTIYKYDLLFRQLEAFAQDKGLVYVSDFGIDNLREFRATWPNKNESARVKLGNLKAFFRFCHDSKWTADNPAAKIKAAKVVKTKIVPLTLEELKKILKVCQQYSWKKQAVRLRALMLLMRFSGLRIGDAVMLRRDAIHGGKLFLRTSKTGTDVFCPLPPTVLEALDAIPRDNKQNFFWSGQSKPKSAVGDYQRSLRKIFKRAGVSRAHPHLFRHTYATALLEDGVPVDTVAVLLGHSSAKVTALYSHWIKGRQENLEAEVKKSWSRKVLNGLSAEA
ncbi:MAG TPA: tyrosine-type recombinase/integrase [Candidatus Acidoferrum sp.]|jgi:integrase